MLVQTSGQVFLFAKTDYRKSGRHQRFAIELLGREEILFESSLTKKGFDP